MGYLISQYTRKQKRDTKGIQQHHAAAITYHIP